MGETLLLLSCGAAFITGLVIAAASLFGYPHRSLSFGVRGTQKIQITELSSARGSVIWFWFEEEDSCDSDDSCDEEDRFGFLSCSHNPPVGALGKPNRRLGVQI
jgi:hypothetical protein